MRRISTFNGLGPVATWFALVLAAGMLAVMTGAGCGGAGSETFKPVDGGGAPRIHAVTPAALKVGDTVSIVGSDFVAPDAGGQMLVIKGYYHETNGQSYPVDLTVEPEYVSSTELNWRLWPDVRFHPQGNQLGRFVGEFQLVSPEGGSARDSNKYNHSIDVLPSLIVRQARPLLSQCAPAIRRTNADLPFAFGVEAIGLQEGTQGAPMRFRWTVSADNWQVKTTARYADAVDTFGKDPIEGSDTLAQPSAVVLTQDVLGRYAELTDPSGGNGGNLGSTIATFLLEDMRCYNCQETAREVELKQLRTRKFKDNEGDSYQANIGVTAEDGTGQTAQLTIPLLVFRNAVTQRTPERDRRLYREAASAQGDCLPAGPLIKNVTYRESTSVSRSTELSITADTNYGGQLGPDFAKFANLSRTFGRTEGESVSSSEEKGTDSSGEILPRQWGQWYRQVVKWEEVAVMTGYDECGNEFPVGEVKMITWKYPVMLATGKKCPPPSPFPAAGDCKKDCGNAYTTNEPGASQTGFNTAEGAAQ